MKKIEIKTNENLKIKDFILRYVKNVTTSSVERALKKGDIKVNNKKVSYSYILNKGDVIKLFISFREKECDFSFLKCVGHIDIFYEDENIIIINKKCGVLSQQDKMEKIENLNNQIKKYLFLKKEWDPNNIDGFVPNLCHRLDKDTTGLIIAAKNLKTLREINHCFTESLIIKKYIALVYGDVPKGKTKIESYIMKNEITNLMEIDKENFYNKKIITEYELIKSYGNYSKIEICIYTGKKHQIRVQMAAINHPVLADVKYNKLNSLHFKQLCLQANEIKFNLPPNHFLSYLNEIEFKLKETKFT